MAGKRVSKNTRIELNRSRLDEITLATADGLYAMAQAVMADAAAAAPVSEDEDRWPHLFEKGGVIAYVRGKKVADSTVAGSPIKPPRAAKVSRQGAIAIGGFTIPARWVELGSVHNTPQPFLTPALMAHQPEAAGYVKAAVADRLAKGATR